MYHTVEVHNFNLQEKTTSTLKYKQTLLKNLRHILKRNFCIKQELVLLKCQNISL